MSEKEKFGALYDLFYKLFETQNQIIQINRLWMDKIINEKIRKETFDMLDEKEFSLKEKIKELL